MGRLSGSIEARARWRADQSCRGRFGRVRDCDARLWVGFGLMVALEAGETGVQPATPAISAGIPTRLIARRRL